MAKKTGTAAKAKSSAPAPVSVPAPTSLVVETVPIKSLRTDPANARRHSTRNIDAIKDSLRRFGLQKPIVVKKDNTILAGNGTWFAAKELGWKEISIVRTDLEGTAAAAFSIIDNRATDLSYFDPDILQAQLSTLTEDGWTPEDLEVSGFSDKDLEEIAADVAGDGDGGDGGFGGGAGGGGDGGGQSQPVVEDEAPEPLKEAVSRTGDLWLLGKHRLLCGDSTKAEDVARVMAGEKAAMCCTDPPYGVNFTNAKGNLAADMSYAVIPGFFGLAIDQTLPGRAVLFFGAESNLDLYRALFNRELRIQPKLLFWKKTNFILRHHDYHSQFECIYYGWTPGGDASTRWTGDRKQSDVWEVAHDVTTTEKEHITQKPIELFAIPMRNHTKPGEVCFEPFSGSGSQIIAAEQLGRRCFGIDIVPQYVDVAVRRWQSLTHQSAVLDASCGDPGGKTFADIAAERGVSTQPA